MADEKKKKTTKKAAAKKAESKPAEKKAAKSTRKKPAKKAESKPSPKSKASTKSKAAEKKAAPELVAAPVVRASARYVRIAPRKARLIADQVRGLHIEKARALLQFSPRGAGAGHPQADRLRRCQRRKQPRPGG